MPFCLYTSTGADTELTTGGANFCANFLVDPPSVRFKNNIHIKKVSCKVEFDALPNTM